MSGFFQSWMERFHAGLQAIPRKVLPAQVEETPLRYGAKRRWLRAALMAAALCLALTAGSRHSWAQEAGQEDAEGGMEDTSLKKKTPEAAAKAPGEVLAPPTGVTFTTRLDRTAVWVGDQFHYLITVDYNSDYDFVLDNTTKETVNMDPFQVMDLTKKVAELKDRTKRLYVDITLANFGTGQSSLQIPRVTLYYFRKDQKSAGADQQAAESLTVPGPVIGLRSTLPPQPSDIRDDVTVLSWDKTRWILPTVGTVCLVLLLAGGGLEAALFVRRRKARKGPDPRKAMEAVRARWSSKVPSDFSDPKTALEFYNNTYRDVKEFVGYYFDTPTMGLTSDEMQEEMKRRGAFPEFTRKVAKVLEACETFKYAPGAVNGNADAARGMAQDVREVLSTKE